MASRQKGASLDMDQLAAEQESNGKALQQIINNYKKDPKERKNVSYYKERLRRLEEAWGAFEFHDSTIRALPHPPLEHAYFTSEYYDSIMKIYLQYQDYFTQKISSLQHQEGQDDEVSATNTKAAPQSLKQASTVISTEDTAPLFPKPTSKTLQATQEQLMSLGANTEELIRLMRRQKGIIQSLRRLLTSISTNNEEHPVQYYELKLKTINQYWTQIENQNNNIWELTDDPASVGYNISEYIELEEKVQEVLVQLSTKLTKPSTDRTQMPSSANAMLKLPKIMLPKFDGDYLKWRQFCDLFKQMVHEQPMPDCQKMWYLKTNLVGEAERLLRHFTLSEENYAAAWKVLQDRYENTRLLVTALVNKLLSQPSLSSETATAASVKALHDTTRECLLGLNALGVTTTNWDPLLLHILIKKLDRTTHTLYEQSLSNPRGLQTLHTFLAFLETRFQSLEALGNKSKGSDDNHRNRNSIKSLTSLISSSTSCISCKGTHRLFACKNFLKLTPPCRLNLLRKHNYCINCLRAGHMAINCTMRGCSKCSKKHNTLVHLETKRDAEKSVSDVPSTVPNHTGISAIVKSPPISDGFKGQPCTLTNTANPCQRNYVLLSTARVKLVNDNGNSIECRALLDSGSQVNLITERAAKRLGLSLIPETMFIQGIGHVKQKAQRRVNILLQSRLNGFSTRVEAFVLHQITPPQPSQSLDTSDWRIPHNIKLADPNFNHPERIDLLLGAEFHHQLLSVGQIRLAEDLPILQNTVFGWILSGKVNRIPLISATCGVCSEDEGLEERIEKFWLLEETEGVKNNFTTAEKRCENHFNQTIRRANDGRFIVSLPFADDPSKLGESKDIALRRFWALERKLEKNDELRQQYVKFMDEYLKLGHMEEVNINTVQPTYYFLPHHSVLKPDSSTTKLRVVFDASTKTSSNISLNDTLSTGPTIQDDLFAILLRFRLPRFVFTADIQKMYRQIWLREEDRKYQLIWWRNNPDQQLKCYQLCTVTYGTTSAPYLATKCLQKLAHEKAVSFPLGSQALQHDFYVDDVITGSNSLATASEIQRQLVTVLKEAGFTLRKWCANHPRLLQGIRPEDQEVQLDFSTKDEESIKTLGLTWLPKSDMFCVKANWTSEPRITKRTVASDIARLFDPLGLMAPVVVTAKIILQKIWQLKMDWDAALPLELHTRWATFRKGLNHVNNIQIPRHVFANEVPKSRQIHTFADASEMAYGAAVYIRSVNNEGRIIVRLLCAKSRVAPTKKITLPRLELCAAKLAVELTNRVKINTRMEETATYYWTDSEIVLAWLNSTASSFHTFVANRVSRIQELSTAQQWRHVSSKENPADVLSRGVNPEKLASCNIWFYGPPFLHGTVLPPPYVKIQQCDIEKRRTALSIIATKTDENGSNFIYRIDHGNFFRKLQNVTAYILRFIKHTRNPDSRVTEKLSLSPQELEEALQVIVKIMQDQEFREDINHLRRYKEPLKNSPLSTLAPFLDERGIIRVGGRLESSILSYDAKHPTLLPYSDPLTKLLMTDIHQENRHVGPQTLLSITRQRFWPIKGKTIARSIVQHCIPCTKAKPRVLSQLMGDLPSTRVQPARPFVNSGVDFCGPIWIHYRGRGKRPQKGYVAVFCCFATKAVHIEIVSDLSTDAFIGALKRFIGRRGYCMNLYCDNATNFVGARNQLEELSHAIYSNQAKEDITSSCTRKGISFNFIPARAPHFGGLWEAAVKSAKHLLLRSVGSAPLTYEELETVMIEIEAILNSRPLTPMSADPNDLTALTPGHFLIGEPLTALIDPNSKPIKTSLSSRWKLVSHIKHEFWRRWTHEYLNQLQCRFKWKQPCSNIKPGTIVIIKEDNTPVMKWALGRIVEIYRGNDGYVRVADVRTPTGILRRPIHKLAPLLNEEEEETIKGEEVRQSREQKSEICSGHKRHTVAENPSSRPQQIDIPRSSEEQNSSHTEELPKKKRRASVGMSMVTLLLTCLFIPVIRCSPVEITQFKPQPGIHFENLGTMNLISSEWNLVVYYDLKPYWMEVEALVNGTQTLKHLCDQITQKSSCSQIIVHFQHILDELNTDNELFMTKETATRNKRGAVNIVGNIANSLFGLLDSEYANQMSKTINDIKVNEGHLLNLLKNQTSIVDSTLNIIKRDQLATEEKFRTLDKQLNQIINRINTASEDSNRNKVTQLFTSLAIQMTLMTSTLQRIQSTIINIISNTHEGKISPLLLSPHQLKKEMVTIRNHLTPSLRLPVDQEDILQVYRLITAEGRVINNHIIFKLRLPLINLEKFDFFRIFPIPAVLNEKLVAINPSSPFLAISPHRDQYYPLTEQEVASCTIVEGETHLCKRIHPIYNRGANISACEVNFLNNMHLTAKCKMRKIENSPIWMQLHHANKWIYALKEQTLINIVCDKEVSSINLEGSGLLTLQPDCIIKHDLITIQGHHIYPGSTRTSYTRLGNLSDIAAPEELAPLEQEATQYQTQSKELETLLQQITSQEIAELPNRMQAYNIHHFTTSYIGLTLIIITIICLIWNIRTRICNPHPAKPKPKPRTRRTHDFSVHI